MKKLKYILLCSIIFISGCSHIYGDHGVIKNRETDYLVAQSLPPLQIPPGYSSDKIDSLYPISEKHYSQQEAHMDLTPPGL